MITEPFQGVRLIHSKSPAPRLIDVFVVEIDLSAPGLSFLVTPSNGALPGDTTPQRTRAFAEQYDAQVAINGSYFGSAGSGQFDVQGLSVSNGDAYSQFELARLVALNVSMSNVATIIQASGPGLSHQPASSLYNAVGGDARLVTNGVNTANSANTAIHPRSAAGVTADQKLILLTVDGRNPGHSEGLTITELADLLIRHGARNAINLDGGGSTTLVLDDPMTPLNDPQVINVPSDMQERAVANNLAVFAAPQIAPSGSNYVFADFENGDEGTFNSAISFSGSNRGFYEDQSTAEAVSGGAYEGQWSQRLAIIDDSSRDGGTYNPGGAWFVRHVSGIGNPANNERRPADGSLGLWAKTTDPNLQIALVVDDDSLTTGERGIPKNLIADGQWNFYEWDLSDDAQWEGWIAGDGAVEGSFSLDSIQIFGPPEGAAAADAEVFIDAISHFSPDEPTVIVGPGDFNEDG
ncbi:MAG: phosphodiester glycosidase family protein, partial [Pirellulales bacterium]|nr:phosphodiester glycosidase family protein [Pirellulales bacterium]